jgi:hypothetical protein
LRQPLTGPRDASSTQPRPRRPVKPPPQLPAGTELRPLKLRNSAPPPCPQRKTPALWPGSSRRSHSRVLRVDRRLTAICSRSPLVRGGPLSAPKQPAALLRARGLVPRTRIPLDPLAPAQQPAHAMNGAVRLGVPGTVYSPILGTRLNEITPGRPRRISRSAKASVHWFPSRRAEHPVASHIAAREIRPKRAQTLCRQIAGSRFPWKIARTTIRSASKR